MRRGAHVVALDNSSRQLATARMFQREFGLRFPLVHADAERPPFADESFDFAISQYGRRSGATPTDGSRRLHGSSAREACFTSRRGRLC